MKGQETLFSHKSDEYITPKWLIEDLKKEFNIRLDVCTTEDNPLGINRFYTIENNGLELDWETWSYCNPPYSQIDKWVQKSDFESNRYNYSIMLIPARTDTKWFHDYIYKKYEIRFLKGRLKFEGTQYPAPFPSMLVIFR